MFPFISTIAQSGVVILDKIILTRRQVALHVFIPILFLFLFVVTILFYPWLGKIAPEAFELKNIILFIGMIVSAIIWNYFYYKGIQEEKVQKFELILMFQPLLTIILASIFLHGENNIKVDIAAIIASIALIFSQFRKFHLEITLGSKDMIIAIIFMSIELILIRLVLNFLSPVALYAIRTGIIFLVFYFIYHPKIFQVSKINLLFILGNAGLASLQMISKFYGFEIYGVVYTSLILILSPLIVYLASVLYFHEKLKTRTVLSALVILGCIVYATIFAE